MAERIASWSRGLPQIRMEYNPDRRDPFGSYLTALQMSVVIVMKNRESARIQPLACIMCFVAFALAPATTLAISRPAEGNAPTEVRVGIFLLDVDEIDDAAQSFKANVYFRFQWQDPRLTHDGPGKVRRPLDEVWHPRLQLVNQQRLVFTFRDIVEIAPDGEVVLRQRAWGGFSQPLDLRDFPRDQQRFEIRLVATGYTPKEVQLVPDPDHPSGMADRFSLADWKILKWKGESSPYVPVSGEEEGAGFVLWFEGERYIGYYVFKIIIPLVFIVAMSWIIFWVKPEQFGTQISVAITAMLTLIAYRFMIGGLIPKVSYLTRMDFFILGSTVLVFATLIQALVTSTLAKGDHSELARSMDLWSRYLFPLAFVLVLLIAFLI